jgi:E3 ubiquitin-protein ligase DOA10
VNVKVKKERKTNLGTLKWVHSSCLLDWIDMKQVNDPTSPIACPQCKSIYNIESNHDSIVSIGDSVMSLYYSSVIHSISAFLASSYLYLVCYGHGLGSMFLMVGKDHALQILQKYPFYHYKLLFRLPFVPFALVLSPFLLVLV